MTPESPLIPIRLLLPVKSLMHAKSRLELHESDRRNIAQRLVQHTLDVALSCLRPEQVLLVTSDPWVKALAQQHLVTALRDSVHDLNAAVEQAMRRASHRFPSDTIAVMVTDLPRLTPPDLMSALLAAVASARPRHIVDQHGLGTTFVSVPPGVTLPIVFGPDSARRFSEGGSLPMPSAPPAISHDLDVISDITALNAHQKENLWLLTPSL